MIYRTRGSQLERYGYAAFGLSVFPYAFMSFVNLICIAVVGDYPSLYVMRTPLLDEAKGRDGTRISGEVGTLKDLAMNGDGCKMTYYGIERTELTAVRMWKGTRNGDNIIAAQVDEAKLPTKFKLVDDDETAQHKIFVSHIDHYRRGHRKSTVNLLWRRIRSHIQYRSAKQIFISLFISASAILAVIQPHLLIFILTGYKEQDSTANERNSMSSWLITDQINVLMISSLTVAYDPTLFIPPDPTVIKNALINVHGRALPLTVALTLLSASIGTLLSISIGGFVMVGKMLYEFGSCSLIP